MKDRGKQFESFFKKEVDRAIKEDNLDVTIDRLYDVIGKKTIDQPADFICYKSPNQIYVECKSRNKHTFSYYTAPQYERLIKKANVTGVRCGMLVWFVQEKMIFWVDIDWLQMYYQRTGVKSINAYKLDEYVKDHITGVYKLDCDFPRINPVFNNIGELFEFITRSKVWLKNCM